MDRIDPSEGSDAGSTPAGSTKGCILSDTHYNTYRLFAGSSPGSRKRIGSEVKFLHCAATVTPSRKDKSGRRTAFIPEQERAIPYRTRIPCSRRFLIFSHMRITRIVGIVLIFALFAGFWAWSQDAQAPETIVPIATSTPIEIDAGAPSSTLVRSAQEPVTVSNAVEVRGTASFVVDGTSYQLTAPEGSTLKDAMDHLQTEGNFTYGYKNYTGLGAFVTSLNNRASTGDMVWILYVNGERSATGISSTRIRSGDLIEWKLEESY